MELSEFIKTSMFEGGMQRDKFFLSAAKNLSYNSFDPSTKCGCIIVDNNARVAGAGVNFIPANLKTCYNDRHEKYKRVIHAEMNAIINGSFDRKEKYVLYTWPAMPCDECVKHIICLGVINRVVYPKATEDYLSRWSEQCKTTIELLNEASIKRSEFSTEYL